MTRTFLLGVRDPEMRRMRQILEDMGETIAFATHEGVEVTAETTYKADPPALPAGGGTLVCLECLPRDVPDGVKVVVIDHHRPGDPGYGMPPAQFWRASSLGQLHALLDLLPGDDDPELAAMDHCFAAAMCGACPGVVPDDVLTLKLQEIAKAHRIDTEQVSRKVFQARRLVAEAPEVSIGGQQVKDMREDYQGPSYALTLIVMQVAVVAEQAAALLWHKDAMDSPDKITLSGHVAPETVKAFMETWGPEQGLKRMYGVPDRGYAGGYKL